MGELFSKELSYRKMLWLTLLFILAITIGPKCCHMDRPKQPNPVPRMVQSMVMVHSIMEYKEYRFKPFGGGVVIHKDGNDIFVLTSAHLFGDTEIAEMATKNKVSLNDVFKIKVVTFCYDKESKPAEEISSNGILMFADYKKDLALIKTQAVNRKFISVKIAHKGPEVGEEIWVIGHPIGNYQTVLKGVLSSKNRNVDGRILWQTDAGAAPGSSGGAVFDKYGQLIGIMSSAEALGPLPITFLGYFVPYSEIDKFLQAVPLKERIY